MKSAKSRSSTPFPMSPSYSKFLDVVFVVMLLGLIVSTLKLIIVPIDQDIFAFVFGVFAIVYLALKLTGKTPS
ncbi:MAG: hypothetical protein A3F33_01060 [Candidatus Woykebacteria bacterium RIFCSPHIGHO2_12_FULL_43_10]|uniref:Uncharacterized protein n=1 Tax=Candidatus Woykebacteria bacterium RIFCSPHIGHO2_02_FULL_43_16b TaxID=1802601 RepID=A0A1G1WQJ5_9BACT|nr:MAG: hypothetical protein A3F33_01060 [Candidatus Woykebacteria bacterium RIFCSPHIGHO2_12_FULL_43_10]OGY30008.1 MAG: hypothetical protein A3J50_02910 [Candidatus Woykebacteria bacterium RIFCSPHIGHO2_02_FULL_43_16b]